MFTASRWISQTAIAPSRTMQFSARRVAGRGPIQRYQSTISGQSSSIGTSHILAGVAGGGAVLLGGYAWYHFSGVKTAVDATKAAKDYLQQTKRSIVENAPKNPNEVIEFLRKTAKSYAGVIPGAATYIDSTFDTLSDLHETHNEDVNKILQQGYDEIRQILKENKDAISVEVGVKVMDALRRRMSELEEIGKRAGRDALASFGEKHPELKEKLGGSYDELRKLAERHGPEVNKIYDDTTSRLKEIFTKGYSPERVEEAQRVIQSKLSDATQLVRSTSQDAWNRAVKEAIPYLDKIPEIKDLIDENASKFMAAGAAQGGLTRDVFAKVKEAAEGDGSKNKEKVKELREFIMKKAQEAQGSTSMEQGWNALQGWIKTMPGGEEVLQKTPDVSAFAELAKKRGQEAHELTRETYEDILNILREKSKKAQELAEETQGEAQRKPS